MLKALPALLLINTVSISYFDLFVKGALNRTRTCNQFLKRELLYQLSYEGDVVDIITLFLSFSNI